MRPRPLFKIEYYQDKGKKLVETIGYNGTQNPMTRTQLRLKIDELRRTTHKTGMLIPVQTNREEIKVITGQLKKHGYIKNLIGDIKPLIIWSHPDYPLQFASIPCTNFSGKRKK